MANIEYGYDLEPHVHLEPEVRHLDAPVLQLDIQHELDSLRALAGSAGGHRAKTLAKYPDMRLVLIALDPGARVETHRAGQRIIIQALDGKLSVHLSSGEAVELRRGGLLQIAADVPHEIRATETSALLVTIAWTEGARPTAHTS